MTARADSSYRHAPVVWRSTLRGVLVLVGDELQLLEGLAASIWLVLADGPLSADGLVAGMAEWDLDVATADVAAMVDVLSSSGLLVS